MYAPPAFTRPCSALKTSDDDTRRKWPVLLVHPPISGAVWTFHSLHVFSLELDTTTVCRKQSGQRREGSAFIFPRPVPNRSTVFVIIVCHEYEGGQVATKTPSFSFLRDAAAAAADDDDAIFKINTICNVALWKLKWNTDTETTTVSDIQRRRKWVPEGSIYVSGWNKNRYWWLIGSLTKREYGVLFKGT